MNDSVMPFGGALYEYTTSALSIKWVGVLCVVCAPPNMHG